jgi:non-ribosomal peptide synthetase component F
MLRVEHAAHSSDLHDGKHGDNELLARGVEPEMNIPLCFNKCSWTIVAMFAVMKVPWEEAVSKAWLTILDRKGPNWHSGRLVAAGYDCWDGAYLQMLPPLAPPGLRVRPDNAVFVVYTSGSTVVDDSGSQRTKLAFRSFSSSWIRLLGCSGLSMQPMLPPLAPPGLRVRPDNAVFVVYTSGSTGKPKGSMHQGADNFLEADIEGVGGKLEGACARADAHGSTVIPTDATPIGASRTPRPAGQRCFRGLYLR